jgi:AraC-like DNA-binding protein
MIGGRPPEKVNWSPAPRNYIIPSGMLNKGNNHLLIRLGVYGRYDGGILNDVFIQHEDEFESTEFYNDLIYKHLPFELLVIFIGFSVSLLIVFLMNRKENLPLYTMSGLFIYILYMLTLLPQNRLVKYETYLAVLMSLIPLFSISIIFFIQALYRIFLNNYNRIIIPLLFSSVTVMALFRDSNYNIRIGFWVTNISLCVSIPYMAFLIFRLNSINRDRFLRNTIITMSIIAAFIILFEYYAFYTGRYYSDLTAKSSPLIFLIVFAVIFYREILRRQIELDFVYKKLGRFEGRDKEVSITDSSEEKLKRVIDFINENYTEDISREGLAAAIGMNPNYMGSLFKTYAGKTISEYINKLRIEDAVRELEEGKFKVIDIAFEVGFENVVTFNRVFKKVTGKTPSEYKNKL